MRIALVAATSIYADGMREESGRQWEPEDMYDDASALSEFAGRQCYESWDRPNPVTATNAGYLSRIMSERHTSVLEHGSVSVRVSGVSRALTHELVRHRHGSYSQLSQRFVKPNAHSEDDQVPFVIHPAFEGDQETQDELSEYWDHAIRTYDRLYARMMTRFTLAGVDARKARKMAAESARMVLPNMAPTAIVVTGNHLYWRHFLEKRGAIDADAEIRQMAVHMYGMLADIEPNLYQDFHRPVRVLGKLSVVTVERIHG